MKATVCMFISKEVEIDDKYLGEDADLGEELHDEMTNVITGLPELWPYEPVITGIYTEDMEILWES